MGIGRPPGRMDPAAYVLQRFNEQEQEVVGEALSRAVEATLAFVLEGIQAAMNRFNAAI
jgi:PTH1 family peptidyl-tRNA hydrolase